MTSHQPPSVGRQETDRWRQPYQEKPRNTPYGKAGRNTSLELLKAAPLIVKLLVALFGGGTTIVVIVAIGGSFTPNPPSLPNPFPTAVQQQWLSDCEGRSFNTAAKCQCQLSYFEQHATAQQFEQDYGAMPPGVVPPEFPGAMDCPS
jgi:hypothetical protein